MLTVVQAPIPWTHLYPDAAVFLVGSIQRLYRADEGMGAVRDWRRELIADLVDAFDAHPAHLVALNPRRDDWDADWAQDIADPRFREQVEWELLGLERAARAAVYFDPAAESALALLELGACSFAYGKAVVCCPPGYRWRGDVQVLCARYEIPLFDEPAPWAKAVVAALRATLGGG